MNILVNSSSSGWADGVEVMPDQHNQTVDETKQQSRCPSNSVASRDQFATTADSEVPLDILDQVVELLPSRYTVLQQLGRGLVGAVYLASDAELCRLVAIKLMLPTPDRDLAVRFRREALALAQLRHPNIVTLYDSGTLLTSHGISSSFMVMEYCQLGTLDEFLHRHQLSPDEAATLVERIAHAVQFAHEQGLVHRDLKPANILLAQASGLDSDPASCVVANQRLVPKIADYGLVSCTSERSTTLTAARTILGTPEYMAPEQAEGRSREATALADIWSLGAILYQLLTRRPPFVGPTTQAVVGAILCCPPQPLREQNPLVPRQLERICLRCLEKTPQRRYASASELADDLRQFLVDRRSSAHSTRLGRSIRLLQTGRPTRWAMLTGMLAFTLIASAVGWLAWSTRELSTTQANHRPALTATPLDNQVAPVTLQPTATVSQSSKFIKTEPVKNVRPAIFASN